jgi:hypothetical protein
VITDGAVRRNLGAHMHTGKFEIIHHGNGNTVRETQPQTSAALIHAGGRHIGFSTDAGHL